MFILLFFCLHLIRSLGETVTFCVFFECDSDKIKKSDMIFDQKIGEVSSSRGPIWTKDIEQSEISKIQQKFAKEKIENEVMGDPVVLNIEMKNWFSDEQLDELKRRKVIVWNSVEIESETTYTKYTFIDIKKSDMTLDEMLEMLKDTKSDLIHWSQTIAGFSFDEYFSAFMTCRRTNVKKNAFYYAKLLLDCPDLIRIFEFEFRDQNVKTEENPSKFNPEEKGHGISQSKTESTKPESRGLQLSEKTQQSSAQSGSKSSQSSQGSAQSGSKSSQSSQGSAQSGSKSSQSGSKSSRSSQGSSQSGSKSSQSSQGRAQSRSKSFKPYSGDNKNKKKNRSTHQLSNFTVIGISILTVGMF